MKITMYLGSMDHTPSEQLDVPHLWHTTVLILSEGGEHWDLAKDIARQMGRNNDTLRKWSGKRARDYKENFERAFKERAAAYPVHIRAISARGRTISGSFGHMVKELGLSGRVRNFIQNRKQYLEFGPFSRVSINGTVGNAFRWQSEPATFIVPERQGIPLVFMAHFLLRMHADVLDLIRDERPELEWVDWQLMPNKFPGDIEGPMAQLFHAIMSGADHARLVMGNIKVVTILDSKADHGSVLADNLAGLLAERLESDNAFLDMPKSYGLGASFFWEVWTQD